MLWACEKVCSTYLCEIGDAFSLVIFEFGIHFLPVVGHREDGVCALESVFEGFFVVDVAGYTFYASGFQGFGIGFGWVTCDTADLEFVGGFGI